MGTIDGINHISGVFNGPVDNTKLSGNNEFTKENLVPGQTISGKLTELNGDTATIDINGSTIKAKIEGNVDLKVGDKLSFTLRTVSENQLTLSPMRVNLDSQTMASKALVSAGLPINQNNINVATSLMDAGLNIDSKTLNSMTRLLNAYPDQSVTNLAQMQKFGLDINEDTIEKFGAFKNYENKISDSMSNIMDGINDTYRSLINSGDVESAMKFVSGVIDIFSNQNTELVNNSNINISSHTELVGNPEQIINNTDIQGLSDKGESLLREKLIITEQDLLPPNLNNEENIDDIISSNKEDVQNANENYEVFIRQPASEENKINVNLGEKLNDAWQILNNSDKSAMVDVLKQAGLGENEAKILLSDNANQNDFLKFTQSIIDKGNIPDSLKDMIQSDKFGDILKSQLQAQWLLSPIDVEKKTTVDQLYDRLNQQTKDITNAVASLQIPNSDLSQNLSNMNQNLNFMNQMNQFMQYVQLPLKMNGSETTGDLYVYTNKKKLSQNDGSVSALLHLDMQNLGPLDVYASITPGNSVFTKFYLKDDVTIDFINDNIHILNERLEKRGYSMKSELVNNEPGGEREIEDNNMITKIKDENVPVDSKLIRKFSFDCLV